MSESAAGAVPERRIVGRLVVTILLALLSVNALAQVALALIGESNDPVLLRTWQTASGLAAGAAAVGAWRLRRWAPTAVMAYAGITATMIASLGPMLALPPEDRAGLPVGAAAVLALCTPIAWFVRRLIRRGASKPATPDLLGAPGVSFPASDPHGRNAGRHPMGQEDRRK